MKDMLSVRNYWTLWTPFPVFPEKYYEKIVHKKDPEKGKNGVHGARIMQEMSDNPGEAVAGDVDE